MKLFIKSGSWSYNIILHICEQVNILCFSNQRWKWTSCSVDPVQTADSADLLVSMNTQSWYCEAFWVKPGVTWLLFWRSCSWKLNIFQMNQSSKIPLLIIILSNMFKIYKCSFSVIFYFLLHVCRLSFCLQAALWKAIKSCCTKEIFTWWMCCWWKMFAVFKLHRNKHKEVYWYFIWFNKK